MLGVWDVMERCETGDRVSQPNDVTGSIGG